MWKLPPAAAERGNKYAKFTRLNNANLDTNGQRLDPAQRVVGAAAPDNRVRSRRDMLMDLEARIAAQNAEKQRELQVRQAGRPEVGSRSFAPVPPAVQYFNAGEHQDYQRQDPPQQQCDYLGQQSDNSGQQYAYPAQQYEYPGQELSYDGASSGQAQQTLTRKAVEAQDRELDRQLELERSMHQQRQQQPQGLQRKNSCESGKENNQRASIPMMPRGPGGAAPSTSGCSHAAPHSMAGRRGRPVHFSHMMVRPEGGQMDAHFNPVHGIRDQMRRVGIQPKDHRKEQRELLHNMTQQRQQQAEADQVQDAEKRRREQNIRNRARSNAQHVIQSGAAEDARTFRRATETDVPKPASAGRRHTPGAVPAYLQRRKAEWADNERARQEEEHKRMECPPGLRLVLQEEKERILQTLMSERAKAEEALRSLPFVIKTKASQQKKDELENRLQEIEGAVAAYSKEKVFVPADA